MSAQLWSFFIFAGLVLSSAPAHALTDDDFLPIELKCPAENNGILVLITENVLGQRERLRVQEANGVILYAALAAAERDEDFSEIIEITPMHTTYQMYTAQVVDPTDIDSEDFARSIFMRALELGGETCSATKEVRDRQDAAMAANRELLTQEAR